MYRDGRIIIGKAGEEEIALDPRQMNRHGLIAGASGTGKTVTLKVIAESLSDMGVPTFIADVKGDLTGMIKKGDQAGIQGRLDSMGITDYDVCEYPVHFFDVYRKNGHPIRAVAEEMDPVLLTSILELTDAQEGVLNIIYKAAEDMDLDLIDLKDLQAMCEYVSDHAKEMSSKYGNVSKQSVGAIQRKLLQLDEQGGDMMFGMPALALSDWMTSIGGKGVMNILECEELFQHPMLYSTFLLWLLDKLYEEMPEVGDVDAPKMVFFFDEAHLLFENASKELEEKVERIVKLIRSKGIGIFFITQSPSDIPDEVLAQLSNRIQHSLRAYTPAEIKAVKLAAQSFRPNPAFKTEDRIGNMKTGTALVSVLDSEGAPTVVQETKILPPRSCMNAVAANELQQYIKSDSLFGKYEKDIDPASAFEGITEVRAQEEKEKAEAEEKEKQEHLAEIEEKEKKRAEARRKANQTTTYERLARKVQRRAETELVNAGVRSAKKFLKSLLK